MAMKKSGLGRGLDSLIPKKVPSDNEINENITANVVLNSRNDVPGGFIHVDINKVEPNRNQPRKNFEEEALNELADSIREHGVIQPLLVQKRDDYYEIIAGERRWRASKLAGLDTIPVIIKNLTPEEILLISLIENIQRASLNPVEEALAYKRLMDEFELTQEEISKKVGKRRSTVANSMRLLKLDDRVKQMLVDETISSGHARAILGIDDGDEQYRIALKTTDEKMNVRDIEKYINNLHKKNGDGKKKDKKTNSQLEAIYSDIEEKLKNTLGTKVKIKSKDDDNGIIEIEYYSKELLTEIIDKLQG